MEEMQPKTKTLCARLHDEVWRRFQDRHDFVETIKEDENFYNGDQWPDNNVNNSIRITNNKIADGIRKLASKINGTPLHLAYIADDLKTDCSALERFDNSVLAKMGHVAFSLQSAINGENLGTEVTYLRFDKDAPWDSGSFYDGGLEEEHVSLLNFAVSNPYQPNIQKQEWVMTWSDVYVAQLRDILKAEKFSTEEYKRRRALLYGEAKTKTPQADDQNPDKDILNETLVRLYVRYFRVKGEVCYEMSTEYVDLLRYPRPLSKVASEAIAKKVKEQFDAKKSKWEDGDEDRDDRQFRLVEDLDIDFEDTIANLDSKPVGSDEHRKYREKFSLYPFAVFVPKVINNFFFGRSITKEMIRIQKGINTALSLQLKGMENMAFSKVYVKDGAMKEGEFYSNNPEDNIQRDHSKGNGNGYYTITPPSMPSELFKVSEYFVNEMKDTYGFNDFANGNMTNQEASGYAVSLMLKQANSTLEQEQQLFWEYQVQLARIRIMFYKHYIDERKYSYALSDTEYAEEEKSRLQTLEWARQYSKRGEYSKTNPEGVMPLMANGTKLDPQSVFDRYRSPTSKNQVRYFRSKDIWGVDFDIKIVAQQGIVESELSTQQWYTNMFGNGGIQAYAENPELLKFIIQTAPKGCLPEEMRANMLHWADSMENSYIKSLEQQVAQLSSALQQAATLGKNQEEAFRQHMQVANTLVGNAQKANAQAQKQMSMLRQGADEGEIKSLNAKGIGGAEQQAIISANPNLM